MTLGPEIPLVVGLVGVGIAILERGWKRFLEQKKIEPELKFDSVYMLNLLVSTGLGTTIVSTIVPALIAALNTTGATTYTGIAAIFINFGLGYGLTYRTLDAMNTSTEKKIELAKAEGEIVDTTTPPPT